MVSPEPVISFLQHFSYIGVFSSIVVSGYILPIPEEVVLLTIGYLTSGGMFSIYFVIIVSFLATLASDIFLYSLAKKDSKLTAGLKIKMHKNSFVKSWMKKPNDIGRMVFMMRFFVGLRFLGPILAGAMNVSLKKFVFYDTLALLLYTPFFVLIGYLFHNSFLRMITRIESVRHLLFFVAIGALSFYLLRVVNKKLSSIDIPNKQALEEELE
jgi:membrane-associated protein